MLADAFESGLAPSVKVKETSVEFVSAFCANGTLLALSGSATTVAYGETGEAVLLEGGVERGAPVEE